MRRVLLLCAAVMMVLVPAACSSGSNNSMAESRYRRDMGRLLAGPLSVTRERIWGRHQIPLWREQRDGQRIVWESNWVLRPPYPEEEAMGVTAAQNQVIMRARRVEGGFDASGTIFRVTFEGYNQVQTNMNTDWHPAPMPDEMKEFYDLVVQNMEMELRVGVRR